MSKSDNSYALPDPICVMQVNGWDNGTPGVSVACPIHIPGHIIPEPVEAVSTTQLADEFAEEMLRALNEREEQLTQALTSLAAARDKREYQKLCHESATMRAEASESSLAEAIALISGFLTIPAMSIDERREMIDDAREFIKKWESR